MSIIIPDIAKDTTLERVATAIETSNALQSATLSKDLGASTYDAFYASSITPDNIDGMFVSWWAGANTGEYTKTQLLERWFNLLHDDKTYGVKFYKFTTSQSSDGELIDNSVTLGVCTPSTDKVVGTDNFCKQKAFWTIEVNYEIDSNGEIEIKAVDKVDSTFSRSGEAGMVGVAQKSGWIQYIETDTEIFKRYRIDRKDGFIPLPECVSPVDNNIRAFMVHAKYMAGLDSNGKLTSATNKAPMNYSYSHNSQNTEWKKRGENYSGISICDIAFRIHMFQLKYAKKGNSGVLEGCTRYNYQYKASISETDVERILLTVSQAANLIVGSNIILGKSDSDGSVDRNRSTMYSVCKNKRIKSIESVVIDGIEYMAINIDNGGIAFNVVANETYISTMPWWSGSCDNVLGVDGSPASCTNGKYPFILQGLETQTGTYAIVADVIDIIAINSDENTQTFTPYTCRLAKNIKSSITPNYVATDKTLTIPKPADWNWHYIGELSYSNNNPEFTTPSIIDNGAGSANGYKSAVHVRPAAGAFEWLAWANLYDGGACGLACAGLDYGLGVAYWGIAAGVSGSGANRGEWSA